MKKTYSELITFPSYAERLEYLRLKGQVGKETFGTERYLNQLFYRSEEWHKIRRDVIVRDLGCDLAIPELVIPDKIYIHHMNPIGLEDIKYSTDYLLSPEYLITVSFATHNAIHYGTASPYSTTKPLVERAPNDTAPWK